ncbi:hypothetical protein BUALT_Bualt02G0133900 [Buddleja alternifolia]|uniref:Uncharacterized protein n=1 Tax=Buddleja alternifolia TaxID=168488 RepID=A0AAV6W5C3_9LAMI|nr:hypothetical protein BUALT_BualtUnG0028900 [Buddleja alternifolia]KAG8388518.1 hypothetical protein BUALT_Bualt02G0133900 [Buddleja alternifolia]
MEENTFDSELIRAIFRLVWERRAAVNVQRRKKINSQKLKLRQDQTRRRKVGLLLPMQMR